MRALLLRAKGHPCVSAVCYKELDAWFKAIRANRAKGKGAAETAGKRVDPYRDAEADRVPQKEQKIAAAVYLYQAEGGGEWGELRFNFENGTAEIVRLADWDTVKSNVFAKMAIRFVQSLPEARLLKSVIVPLRWK